MSAISRTFNPRPPYGILMRGRPDEPDSWQSLAVYSKDEWREFVSKGWKPSREFMERADRARSG